METVLSGSRSQQLNEEGLRLTIQRSPSEKVLASLYLKLWQEGLLPSFFHERVPELSEYLEMWKNPRNVVYACFLGSNESENFDVVGLGCGASLTPVGKSNRCEVSMVFLRSAQRMSSAVAMEFCEMVLDSAFTAEDLNLICVTGTTPVPNKPAVQFLRRIGFQEVGVMPACCTWDGEACDAVISVMTRANWFSSERK